MGASASVIATTIDLVSPESWADAAAREYWHSVDHKMNAVCEAERRLLVAQSKVMFRKHDDIIRMVMCKTKKQMSKLVGDELTPAVLESLGGGPYAKFLSLVSLPTVEVMVTEIDVSIGGVGCNEETLAMALAACDAATLTAVASASKRRFKTELPTMVAGKTKRGSPLQKFLLRILQGDRDDEAAAVDSDLASAQAQQLHTHGAAKSLGVQEDPIIEILARASRTQCVAISSAYQRLNNMTLVGALQTKFSGAAMLAMCMWTLPVPEALAFLFHYLGSNCSDGSVAARVMARYDKPFLKTIDECCRRSYNNVGIYGLVEKSLSGNLAKSVLAWLNSQTPDGGNEAKIDEYISASMQARGDHDLQHALFAFVGQADASAALKAMLEQTSKSLDRYIAAHLPELAATLAVAAPAGSASAAAPVPAPAPPPRAARPSMRYKVSAKGRSEGAALPLGMLSNPSFEKSFKSSLLLIEDYLHSQFHHFDPQCTGAVPAETFWDFWASLPLESWGFTADEVSSMREFVDWEHDGVVCFDEVKDELADSIIDCLHEHSLPIAETFAALGGGGGGGGGGGHGGSSALPPDLLGYLRTTFDTYDLDGSGELEWEEFWQYVNALNLGISEYDFARVQAEWDSDHDGGVSWREALKQLTAILARLMADRQDHYIGLVDAETQGLFWYNIKDQSSCWMSAEDQEAYKAHAVAEEQERAAEAEAAMLQQQQQQQQRRNAAQPTNVMLIKRRSIVEKKGTARFVP